jgi:DNA sulfur modification protein DndD
MILEQLTVRNFCLFRGEQVFALTPLGRNGRHLPITLFGGINGGGKTTLLDAIQLALYGGRARCSKRSSLAYDDFLRESIHHGVNGSEPAGVALAFRYAADGQDHLYEVSRSWKVADGRLREELRVSQDGKPEAWLAENWPQLVENLFPLEISQLFFFDAEKIRALAEDDSSSKALGAAIKALLGLDIVERLITDTAVVQTRLAKKLGTPEQQAQVEELESLAQEHQNRIAALNTERAGLENDRLRAESEQKAAEAAFAARGGQHWDARKERRERLVEVADQETGLRGQLVALAAGELPLALVADLLARAEEQDRHERQAVGAEVTQQLLLERDGQLLAFLRRARAGAALLRTVSEYLESDRRSRQPGESIRCRLELSEAARALLRHLRGQKLTELRRDADHLLYELARVVRQREELERALAATPDEADISGIMTRLKAATERLTLLNDQAGRLEEALAAERQRLEDREGKLRQLWEGKMDEQFKREDGQRMMQLAGRTRETMQVFLQRVTAQKIDRLSALVTECFRFLLRKTTLVERILIDPATFAITLHDQAGLAIAKQRLSEGEKQIFAIAVLWGLARAAGRPLPAVIDTPMARLDAAHRQHLVERYFPNASHQVVIFSTDTEVDRQFYRALQPAIARAYHLNYDDQEKRTVGEEGYFWKE